MFSTGVVFSTRDNLGNVGSVTVSPTAVSPTARGSG